MAQNLYTSVANSMITSTEVINTRMAKDPVGMSRRLLKVTALAGPSSGGGELSRQSLTLSSGNEAPVCGWVDFVGNVAEIRDYASTKRAYEARYRTAFDVNEGEYRNLCSRLMTALRDLSVRGAVVGDDANYAVTDPGVGGVTQEANVYEPEEVSGPSLLPVILGAGLAGMGIAVAVYLIMR